MCAAGSGGGNAGISPRSPGKKVDYVTPGRGKIVTSGVTSGRSLSTREIGREVKSSSYSRPPSGRSTRMMSPRSNVKEDDGLDTMKVVFGFMECASLMSAQLCVLLARCLHSAVSSSQKAFFQREGESERERDAECDRHRHRHNHKQRHRHRKRK